MDLTGWLLRHARPSVFLVTGPGGTQSRLAVERLIRERGYRQALSPAEANLLITCGSVRGALDEAVQRVWAQLALPRARAHFDGSSLAADVPAVLDRARAELTDVEHQRRARTGPSGVGTPGQERSGHDLSDEHRSGEGGQVHDMSGQEGSGHDMSDMELPGGLAMAERGPDRDGLTLDQLHLPLGPALPDWPSGLCLRLVIQGDVVQEAAVELVDESGAGANFWAGCSARAAALDSLCRLLSVAGWRDAGLAAQRLRDAVLADPAAGPRADPDPATCAAIEKWARRIRRSRLLRWSTDGLGVCADANGADANRAHGDATARWLRWLDLADGAQPSDPGAVDGSGESGGNRGSALDAPSGNRGQAARRTLDLLPELLVGQELAAVRLIVASLDPDLDAMLAAPVSGGGHA